MKKIILGASIVGVIIVAILVGLWFKGASNIQEKKEGEPTPTVAFPTISDSITVELTNVSSGVMRLRIVGIPSTVETVEYELTYITGAGLPRGVLGKITTNGETEIVRSDIVLGTCSSGKCVYDSGVTSIDLSLKFNSPTGVSVFHKTYQLQ
ncbi:hypothetical protein HYW55_02970 [Candidatus Gottesmanbacteria bacterium]|nr:hypothetical protein [Candidatus Gottesmanbacteria bacterium]